ncbi:variable surface protein [Plasmodium gonderi]|uniref:Variable surface protein n=1 Tax=Plasmodium gonderi TaxID=77519 RepID=A0A1Y1JII0_PLAGO|nr:variable surface protein [Plasmodium gonderi]GAW82040.1 variable surface protein [Plasmodium gonderi]
MADNVVKEAIQLLNKNESVSNDLKFIKFYNMIINTIINNTYKHGTFNKCGKRAMCDIKDNSIRHICCNAEYIIQKWGSICKEFRINNYTCNDFFIYWLYGKINESKCNANEINQLYNNVKDYWKCGKSDKNCVNIDKKCVNIDYKCVNTDKKCVNIDNKCVNTDEICVESDIKCFRKFWHIKEKNVLKNKKELYDFLQYYKTIKILVNKNSSVHKEKYCNYINYIFLLYEKIHKDYNALHSGYYDEEIERFKNIFKDVDKEFAFLQSQCSKNKVELVLDNDNKKVRAIREDLTTKITEESLKLFQNIETGNLWKTLQIHKFYSWLNQKYEEIQKIPENPVSSEEYINKNTTFNKLYSTIKNILTSGDYTFSKQNNSTINKNCDYINYWLYGKLKDNEDFRNIIPFLYDVRKLFVNDKLCKSKVYNFHIEHLEKKIFLYKFLEFYKILRSKFDVQENGKKIEYCNYIKEIFNLYKDMEQDKENLRAYAEEINYFKETFLENIHELSFLSNRCPGKCLKDIFSDKYKKKCKSEQEPSSEKQNAAYEQCSEHNSSTIHNSEDENDLILKDTQLYKLYNEFNNDINNDYENYCTELNRFECKYKGGFKLCSKLVKNLMHLSRMPKNEERNKHCYALKHWLHEEIRKIFHSNYTDVSTEQVMKKFKEVAFYVNNNYLYDKPCYCFFDGSLNTWKEEKQLHDYFQTYDQIKNMIETNDKDCKKYFNYLTSINKLYGDHLQKCCYCYYDGECSEDCPNYFKCSDEFNPYNIFLKLKCGEEYIKKFKEVKKAPSIDHYVITASLKSLLYRNMKTAYDMFYMITLSIFGMLGMFLIFFIFYKFTPFGPYLHRNVINNKKSNNKNYKGYDTKSLRNNLRHPSKKRNDRKIQFSYLTA